MKSPIYFDNAASTPPLPEVASRLQEATLHLYGNPSSMHIKGRLAQEALEETQLILARHFDIDPHQVVFTSGGTESNNLAIWGALGGLQEAFRWMRSTSTAQLLTTTLEHPSVLKVFQALEHMGAPVQWIPVTSEGMIHFEKYETLLSRRTRLVSIHHIQNTIGTCQNIKALAALLKQKQPDALLHVDAVQSWLKTPLSLNEWGIDLLSLSAHKNNGPKGLGILILGERFAQRARKLGPLLLGGDQQHGLRPSTVTAPTITAFSPAIKFSLSHWQAHREHLVQLRNTLKEGLPARAVIHGPVQFDILSTQRAPHILNFSLPGLPAAVIVEALAARGYCISAGSACHSTNPKPNEIVLSLGAPQELALSAVRVSFGFQNTLEEVNGFQNALQEVMGQYL